MSKVVITDYTFSDIETEREILEAAGCTVMGYQCRTPDQVTKCCAEADAVIAQFAPVRREAIDAMSKARVIVRYGIGYDNVDLVAARERNIPVCNVPDYCIDEVADHTIAFILSLNRQVLPNHLHTQSGKWGLPVPLTTMRCLRDLTVGCVGFGRIGREVLSRLSPFKCRRLVFDPVVDAATIRAAGCEPASLEQIFGESDVLTLHCPSTDQTRRMVNATSLQQMKLGSAIVNLARGDLIETAALIESLRSGHLSGAALDVFEVEPLPADSPLRSMPNVILASHIASASPKAVKKLRETAAKLAAMALRGEPLINIVNGVRAKS
jgi:D-3-phosphoglycerate dehydrogenase / 2-oxoglutarate reductase